MKNRPMKRVDRILSKIPDCDDALRRLSNVLKIPLKCRKRTCRSEGCCQGGYGPPCYFEHRSVFTEAVHGEMHEYRDYWTEQRESLRAFLRQ